MSKNILNRVFLTIAATDFGDATSFAVMNGQQIVDFARSLREQNGLTFEDMLEEVAEKIDVACLKFGLEMDTKEGQILAASMVYLASNTGSFAVYPVTDVGLKAFERDVQECASCLKENAVRRKDEAEAAQ
jgi:hypothetical protein